MFDFTDKVITITGGGKGIGKDIALGFANAGAKTAIWDLDQPAAQEVAEEIVRNNGTAIALKVDITCSEGVEAAVKTTLESFGGRLDVLINNAGMTTRGMIEKLTPAQWRSVLDVNLTGPFICAQKVLPVMKEQKSGRIINIASIAAKKIAHLGGAHYTASKAGLLGFTRHLAYEAAPFGITVNAICPGGTATPLMEKLTTPEEMAKRVASIPMGRLTRTQDHVNAVMFLASSLAEMITGQAIDVDGGQLISWYDFETYTKLMT